MLTKLKMNKTIHSKHIGVQVLGLVHPQVYKQTKGGVVSKVWGQIRDRTRIQVWRQVQEQVLDEMEDQIWNQEAYLSLYYKYV